MFECNYQKILYWLLFITIIAISSLGCTILYSVDQSFAERQIQSNIIFCFVAVIISLINSTSIKKFSPLIYVVTLILLLLTNVIGHKAMGAQRWLQFGPVIIQPSEIAKITTIAIISSYFSERPIIHADKWIFLIPPFTLFFIPGYLILKQPNLGTAIVIVFASCAVFFYAGIGFKKILFLLLIVGIIIPISWEFFLLEYQKSRIMTFLNPEGDSLGAGYNILQSQIAIGSGGLYGKGFMQGIQNNYNFLPEKHTDFIFSVLAEELGYIGVILTLFLYFFTFFIGTIIANNTKCYFHKLLIGGGISILFIQVVINTGMISGLLPVVGIPLPFISYGRSSLLSSWMIVGIMMSGTNRINSRKMR